MVAAGDRRRLPPETGGPSVLTGLAGLAQQYLFSWERKFGG